MSYQIQRRLMKQDWRDIGEEYPDMGPAYAQVCKFVQCSKFSAEHRVLDTESGQVVAAFS